MKLRKLDIDKIIIHQIFQKEEKKSKKIPLKSSNFINFDDNALDTFKSRITEALGETSKSVEMKIIDHGDNSLAKLINDLSVSSDKDFIDISYKIAKKLDSAQDKRNILGGIVAVFRGNIGTIKNRRVFIGVMKAEIYSAYQKLENEETHQIGLKFVEEALLTPTTKLYKTAGFVAKDVADDNIPEDYNTKWSVSVSDSQITQTDGKAAARYFYETFMGCGYPESAARHTMHFYDETCSFIERQDLTPPKKNDLYNALTTYLKENSEVIIPNDFATRHLPLDLRDPYNEHLSKNDVPTESFAKNTEFIQKKLKYRKLSFNNNVKISAPSDVFKKSISIETINEDQDGNPVEWTKIIVKDKIVSQE